MLHYLGYLKCADKDVSAETKALGIKSRIIRGLLRTSVIDAMAVTIAIVLSPRAKTGFAGVFTIICIDNIKWCYISGTESFLCHFICMHFWCLFKDVINRELSDLIKSSPLSISCTAVSLQKWAI